MTQNFKREIVNGLIRLTKKDRVFSKAEIKEFLVYYVFNFLILFVNKHNISFPYTIIDDLLIQIESSCDGVLDKVGFNYEQVDPKNEILFNIDNSLVPELTKRYLNYVF